MSSLPVVLYKTIRNSDLSAGVQWWRRHLQSSNISFSGCSLCWDDDSSTCHPDLLSEARTVYRVCLILTVVFTFPLMQTPWQLLVSLGWAVTWWTVLWRGSRHVICCSWNWPTTSKWGSWVSCPCIQPFTMLLTPHICKALLNPDIQYGVHCTLFCPLPFPPPQSQSWLF